LCLSCQARNRVPWNSEESTAGRDGSAGEPRRFCSETCCRPGAPKRAARVPYPWPVLPWSLRRLQQVRVMRSAVPGGTDPQLTPGPGTTCRATFNRPCGATGRVAHRTLVLRVGLGSFRPLVLVDPCSTFLSMPWSLGRLQQVRVMRSAVPGGTDPQLTPGPGTTCRATFSRALRLRSGQALAALAARRTRPDDPLKCGQPHTCQKSGRRTVRREEKR